MATKTHSSTPFPGYQGCWPLQNLICAVFHNADLARALREDEESILPLYGVTNRDERNLIIPSQPRHLNESDVEKIFDHCRAELQKTQPWRDGVPATGGQDWRQQPEYQQHWPVQNLFNRFINDAAIARTLVDGSADDKRALFDHLGVDGGDRELFLSGLNPLEDACAQRLFDKALAEFAADRPKNVW